MEPSTFLLYAFISALGSLLVGMMGTGSSLILLPSLIFAFSSMLDGYDHLRLAAGTTMATIAVGAIAGGVSQYRNGAVDIGLVLMLAIPYSIGALLGPWLSGVIDTSYLRIYIAVLLVSIGVSMLFNKGRADRGKRDYKHHRVEMRFALTGIATACSLGGIASGVLAMPYLMRFSIPTRMVIGSSTAAAGIYATFAAIGYVLTPADDVILPSGSLGYVFLPAFVVMACVSALFTPLGVAIGRRLNVSLLKSMLASFLILAGLSMFFR